jgi:hypothetical protein
MKITLPLPSLAAALCASSLICACSNAPSTTRPPEPVMPAASAATPPAMSTSPALPPAHPPIGTSGKLAFTAPEGWIAETPSSPVRKAQFKLPHQGTDTEDAKLVVYLFGKNEGGSVEDNFQRWAGEYEQPDGRKSSDVAVRSTRKVNGMDVSEIDIKGTCVAETAPGSGQRTRKESWRTLAAIVQSDHGSYFVKMMGPAATIGNWEPSFRKYVSSATPQ